MDASCAQSLCIQSPRDGDVGNRPVGTISFRDSFCSQTGASFFGNDIKNVLFPSHEREVSTLVRLEDLLDN